MSNAIVISAAVRTPIGRFMGELASVTAPELGAAVIKEAVSQAGVAGEEISEAYMGCVLAADCGQAPARQAVRLGGLPDSVGATTVNKVCGSGMKSVMLAVDVLRAGSARVVVAGGMESMSNAPYLVGKARQGLRIGHADLLDHLMRDGLEDAYERKPMGSFGEQTAQRYQFTRLDQDAFAAGSLLRAQEAIAAGEFDRECVDVATLGGNKRVSRDENPPRVLASKIPTLKAAFGADGTITAASSSANADGAAAFVLARESVAKELGLPVRAVVRGMGSHARKPSEFTMAPSDAIREAVGAAGWKMEDVDLFEINEAFAAVVMAAERDLGLSRDCINVRGGACALGHPIGASGARILVTLLHAMEDRGAKRGVASLCIGGGEAVAVAIELV